MPDVMDWQQGDSFPVITRALQHLQEGRLVVFPTESVYMVAAGALASGSLQSLDLPVPNELPWTLILGQAVQLFDWLPHFRGVGIRLARRFWPGPLTLVSGAGIEQGVWSRLPAGVRQSLAPHGRLALRLPNHAALRQAALRLPMPLVAAATPWATPEQVLENLGDQAALIIQDGRTAFGLPDTVAAVEGRQWQLLADGALPRDEISAAAPCHIVFVCTGNTCRSPMAAGLCRQLLADRLHCASLDLAKHGFLVQSAGLAAMMGMPAAEEAATVAREFGADLTDHASQSLTVEMLLEADRLFVMTASHLRLLEGVRGATARLLAADGADIADPIGGTLDDYQQCARQILTCLEKLLPELLEC